MNRADVRKTQEPVNDLPRPDTLDEAIRSRDAWFETARLYANNAAYWEDRARRAEAKAEPA